MPVATEGKLTLMLPTLESEGLVLTNVKLSEDGRSIVLCVLEVHGKEGSGTL